MDVCHGAENLFDMLRNGKRTLSAELMDVILQALDAINVMFAQVQNREEISPLLPICCTICTSCASRKGRSSCVPPAWRLQPEPEPEPEPAPEPEVIAEVAPVAVNGGGSIDGSPPTNLNACSMSCTVSAKRRRSLPPPC